MINNQLDTTIFAFHLINLTPFEILPHSTSIFAFDEPFICPSVGFWFNDQSFYRISLVEDTDKIEMKNKYKDKPVYIQIKKNNFGNRLITISQENEEPIEKYKFIFKANISGIAISIIDFQIREVALIYLSKLVSQLTFNSEYLAIKVSLKSFQIDDQNPLAINPTVLYGYFTESCPYLTFNCLCPMKTSAFTSIDYFSLNFQRIDVCVDSSFISDWMNLSSSMKLKTIHSIKPKKPSKLNQKSLISFKYFEIAPALIILRYNRTTARPPMMGEIFRFLKFVPSIKARKMVLPGIVLSHITDRIESIQTKLINDYKTATFNAILGMLGSGGKLLKILGIASAIASSFNIKMTSDMKTQFTSVPLSKRKSLNKLLPASEQIIETESSVDFFDISKFDNIVDDEFCSFFSFKSLSSLATKVCNNSMNSSPLIQIMMPKFSEINEKEIEFVKSNKNKEIIEKKLENLQNEKNEIIEKIGLKLKIMPGIEYGHGIAGVLTKELNDPLEKVEPMSKYKRIRETRPFAGAKISVFDHEIAIAQKIIFQNGGLTEKVKEISVSNNGQIKTCIIMTEKTLYVFSDDLKNILMSVKISDIHKVIINDNNEVKMKLKSGKTVIVQIDSSISLNFLLSLLRMNHQFEESLLL